MSKQFDKAFKELLITDKTEIVFGDKKEHKLTRNTHQSNIDTKCTYLRYYHYDTLVMRIVIIITYTPKRCIRECLIRIGGNAWSSTDRNNCNSLLDNLSIKSVRVYKKQNDLFFCVDGRKTEIKQISLEDC